jgi:hypothetical protein
MWLCEMSSEFILFQFFFCSRWVFSEPVVKGKKVGKFLHFFSVRAGVCALSEPSILLAGAVCTPIRLSQLCSKSTGSTDGFFILFFLGTQNFIVAGIKARILPRF